MNNQMKEYDEEESSPTRKNKPKITVAPSSDGEQNPSDPAAEPAKRLHKKTEQQKKLYQEDID